MKKIVLIIFIFICSRAFGLTLMGPPTAELKQGQGGLGLNLSYSEMDIEERALGLTETLKDVESFSYLVNLGYGVKENWDFFVRLGLTDIEYDDIDFDGNSKFAYGFGTKATFIQQDSVVWGGLFQILWLESDDNIIGIDVGIDYYEIQIAFGPTYQVNGTSIYGGPFLHLIDGNIDYSTLEVVSDIEQESELGGYIGLHSELDENSKWQIELQLTGDAYAICLGISWKF